MKYTKEAVSPRAELAVLISLLGMGRPSAKGGAEPFRVFRVFRGQIERASAVAESQGANPFVWFVDKKEPQRPDGMPLSATLGIGAGAL